MQQRYYDPTLGRFMSNDPLGYRDVHSFNRYAYANNNPFKFIDPDGRNPVVGTAIGCAVTGPACPVGAVIGAVLGSVVGVVGFIAYNEFTGDDEPSISDREPGADGKQGSTGGPSKGKKFKPEPPKVRSDKEGVSCRYCGQKTTNKSGKRHSRERDHIDPKSRDGNNSSDNDEGDSCRTCNRSKGAKNPDEWQPKIAN